MANIVKHRFASGKTDGPDASQVQPSHWNDGHLFSGGNAGDLLARDPTDASFGAKWTAPPAPVGVWQTIPFDTANFLTDSGMTWTVASGGVLSNRYMVVGKTLFWYFWIDGTIAGTMYPYVRMKTPGGFTNGPNHAYLPLIRANNPGPISIAPFAYATELRVNFGTLSDANLTAGTFQLRGSVAIEIA